MDDGSLKAEFASLWMNYRQLAQRVRDLEKMIDTRDSPWWKRLKWRLIDGYPPWCRLGERSVRWWMVWKHK